MELVFDCKEEKMSNVIRAEYLYNNLGTHDEVYNVILRENHHWAGVGMGGYIVEAERGPRLGVLKTQTKYTGSNRNKALWEFSKIVASKIAKGYRPVSGDISETMSRSIPKQTTKKETKPVVEEYNDRMLDPDL